MTNVAFLTTSNALNYAITSIRLVDQSCNYFLVELQHHFRGIHHFMAHAKTIAIDNTLLLIKERPTYQFRNAKILVQLGMAVQDLKLLNHLLFKALSHVFYVD